MRFLQTSYNAQLWTSNPYLAASIYGQSFSTVNTTSSLYSTPIPIYPTEIINLRGQVYMNPVGVITNANTFSAAELFVGMMKDFASATVFGEDTTTGGGGGTLISSIDLNTFDNSTFIPLLNGQYIKLPWAQVIRPSGALIEDVGITSDVLLSTYSVFGVSDWVSGPISTEVIAAANTVAKSATLVKLSMAMMEYSVQAGNVVSLTGTSSGIAYFTTDFDGNKTTYSGAANFSIPLTFTTPGYYTVR
ncbi:hypothetical protein HDU76_012086, partial [Blyttiomyces sp. JEL0837]